MIAHHFEHHDFYVDQGLHYLRKLGDLIEDGRVPDRFKPWAAKARTNYEELRSEIKKALKEQEEQGIGEGEEEANDGEAGVVEDVEEEKDDEEQEEQDEEEEDDVYQTSVAAAEQDDMEPSSSQARAPSEVTISNISYVPSKFPLSPAYPRLRKWPLEKLR